MKLLLLADPNSIHTVKWALALDKLGIQVHIIGVNTYSDKFYLDTDIKVHSLNLNKIVTAGEGNYKKIAYFKLLPFIQRKIKEIKPDIVHSHYVSSYGLIGAFAGFHPYVISVWGSDIFSFPKISFFHKLIIRFALSKADKILSTSQVMAKETTIYTKKNVEVTPFGINLNTFKKIKIKSLFTSNEIVIGTIKTLEKNYGIEYLIKSFEIIRKRNSNLKIKLLIVGSGSIEEQLKNFVLQLKLQNDVIFTGSVIHSEVPFYLNMIDIFVALSLSESFGVAIVEAQACEKPVVVSNVGGLPEVVEDKITGFVVPPKDEYKAAEAIETLVLNKDLRLKMGNAGRERVKKYYNWEENVNKMIDIYEEILK